MGNALLKGLGSDHAGHADVIKGEGDASFPAERFGDEARCGRTWFDTIKPTLHIYVSAAQGCTLFLGNLTHS
ncbi:hypothetical protein Aple_050960 [Acrocarpospora pleiomorpha]|uniref:Uncharacterized protein n=1 Tax=Acrocarpospora pleiomorpha TaxID=90975 RepID=A0A5M3XQ58_9ACTN|nr:hypothetical protein Aple_050960 [Acrocarpospora pleiomorpha]